MTRNADIRNLLLVRKPVGLITKKGRLRWFGYVEHKDDVDSVKHRMMQNDGTGQGKTRDIRAKVGGRALGRK